MRIVVVGGAGDLGGRVMRVLRERGHDVHAASRRTGVDLATGEGLDQVLNDADAVVHTATSNRRPFDVDVAGARRLAESVLRHNSPAHIVSVSIVGCDRVAWPYYRAKVAAEDALKSAGAPATVLRATQFHSLAAFLGVAARVGPFVPTIGDMRIQPVDIDWVAERLADSASGPAPNGYVRAPDLAGPTAYDAREMAALLAAHDGRPMPRLVRVPLVHSVLRSFARGEILPGPEAELGGQTFEAWLKGQPRPMPRRFYSPT